MSLVGFFILILISNFICLFSFKFFEKKIGQSYSPNHYFGLCLVIIPWIAFFFSAIFINEEFFLRQLLSSLLVSFIGLRLLFKVKNTKKTLSNKNLLQRGFFYTVILSPLISVNFLPGPVDFNILDLLGILVFTTGMSCQIVSERRLTHHNTNVHKIDVCISGMWKHSRHPNYLGVLLQWYGIFIITCSAVGGFWSIYSPLFLTFYLRKYSEKKEAILKEKIPSYGNYAKHTNRYFPDILGFLQIITPHRSLTFIFSILSKIETRLVKNTLIYVFCLIYRPNLKDAKLQNIKEYSSFNHFFIRKLQTSSRPISSSLESVVSPVDGEIVEFGEIDEERLIQAKKFKYKLSNLINKESSMGNYKNGFFVTLYLGPKNYHRIHCPYEGTISETKYIQGSLYGVNSSSHKFISNLYTRNERAWMEIECDNFSYILLCVGASVVGSIIPFWNGNVSNKKGVISSWVKGPKEDLKKVKRGQELGFFNIGSTIILVFSNNFNPNKNFLSENKSVKFGEIILKT